MRFDDVIRSSSSLITFEMGSIVPTQGESINASTNFDQIRKRKGYFKCFDRGSNKKVKTLLVFGMYSLDTYTVILR